MSRHTDTTLFFRRTGASGPFRLALPGQTPLEPRRLAVFSALHGRLLEEMYSDDSMDSVLHTLLLWQETRINLEALRESQDCRLPRGLVRKLECLFSHMDAHARIPVGRAHGDFTPWNTYVSDGRLFVYDWELTQDEVPLLWDAFHFVFQSGILIHGHDAREILARIYGFRKELWYRDLREKYRFDFQMHLQLYLLMNITCCLDRYIHRDDWGPGVYKLLETWGAALSIILAGNGMRSERQLLLMDLADWLQRRPFAVLNRSSARPEDLPPFLNLEVCVERPELKKLTHFLTGHPFTAAVHSARKASMHAYTVRTREGALLTVEAIHRFKRQALTFLNADRALPGAHHSAEGVRLPEPSNRGISAAYNWLLHLIDSARSRFAGGGMIIAFSGMDAAGNSALIERVRSRLENGLGRRVIVIRRRAPGPTGPGARRRVSSILRAAYLYLNYMLGPYYMYIRHVLRGNIVIYDRYYLDLIEDGHRRNIRLSPDLVSSLYRFMRKPDLNFLVYAGRAEFPGRGKTLEWNTINELTESHLRLFDTFRERYGKSRYIPVRNRIPEHAVQHIFDHIGKIGPM